MATLNVALAGNPNAGKTTLFNALTASDLRTANWPGVTVDIKSASARNGADDIRITDIPGTYSLDGASAEERTAAEYIASGEVDAVINVIDSTCLERGLYLTLSLIETGRPVVAALNMADEARRHGIVTDTAKLGELLGIPVIRVSARKNEGCAELLHAVRRAAAGKPPRKPAGTEEKYRRCEELARSCVRYRKALKTENRAADTLTMGNVSGPAFFVCVAAAVFLLSFLVGSIIGGAAEKTMDAAGDGIRLLLCRIETAEWCVSLLCDGIIPGVGGVLAFLPELCVLFGAVAVLEDCGYMARAACVLDPAMRRIGLSGKAAVVMLLAFGCSVPAAMSSRIIGNFNEKRKLLFVLPYASCGAKLPVYLMLSRAFFDKWSVIIIPCLYCAGLAFAGICSRLYGAFGGVREAQPLLIELPRMRVPCAGTVLSEVRSRAAAYICRAGSLIFVSSIIIWALCHIGAGGYTDNPAEAFIVYPARFLSPLLAPCGLGCAEAAVAVICGLAAKEMTISSLCIMLGASGAGEATAILCARGFGAANALSLMVFTLLFVPCAAASAAIARESRSAAQSIISLLWQALGAWGVCVLLWRICKLIL